MLQVKNLITLLNRNEDWILSRILYYAREFNHSIYSTLINHSWRQTVSGFSQIISQFEFKNTEGLSHEKYSNFEENKFQGLAREEASRCLDRGIAPQVFMALLKIIRNILNELVQDSRINSSEKNKYNNFLYSCFDNFEIAYIESYYKLQTVFAHSEIKKEPRNELKKFKTIYDNLPTPLLIIDSFHKIVRYNKEAENTFPFLVSGKNNSLNGSIQFEGGDTLSTKIDEFFISEQKDTSIEATLNYNNKTGYFLVNFRKYNLSDHIMVCFLDLTKWKQVETNLRNAKVKAENSDKLKTTFLANMSHEIRTPMNAIVGFAELLSMSNPSKEEREEYLNLIKKSSNDLLTIIEDVIDIAKIESQQLKIVHKNLKLYDLFSDLKRIYDEILYKHDKTNIKLTLRIPEAEKNLIIHTDPKRLKQVLSNLIGNAIKFTEEGHIEFGYKLAENKIVYFYVKDTGIGIPKEMQTKIFNRFIQVEESFDKNINGTGLGLAISKNIINLMGGNIWVSSKPAKGSNFYFYLPYLKAIQHTVLKSPVDLIRNENLDLSNYTILVAEDEEANFFFLKESLKKTGINIIRATNGLEAINLAENTNNIDLILMDIKMPEVNGIEASRYISHIKPNLPIVAQTAFAMDNDKKTCLDAGCFDYISKPIKRDKLIDIIIKALKSREVDYHKSISH